MSTTVIATLVIILSQVLRYFGIEVADADLNTTLNTGVTVLAGLWIYKERVSWDDVNLFGLRK